MGEKVSWLCVGVVSGGEFAGDGRPRGEVGVVVFWIGVGVAGVAGVVVGLSVSSTTSFVPPPVVVLGGGVGTARTGAVVGGGLVRGVAAVVGGGLAGGNFVRGGVEVGGGRDGGPLTRGVVGGCLTGDGGGLAVKAIGRLTGESVVGGVVSGAAVAGGVVEVGVGVPSVIGSVLVV